MRGPVGAEAHDTLDFKAATPFFAVSIMWMTRNQSRSADIRVLEDRADQDGKAIGPAPPAVWAFPMEWPVCQLVDPSVPQRGQRTRRPAPSGQIRLAGISSGNNSSNSPSVICGVN